MKLKLPKKPKHLWLTIKSYAGFPTFGGIVCDPKTYTKGQTVALSGDLSRIQLDTLCAFLRKQSGARVDWSWYAGRGLIKAYGDLEKVRANLPPARGQFMHY